MINRKYIDLTAPYVGILKRIVTINIDNYIKELVNPKIIYSLGKQKGEEGSISCLEQTVIIIKLKIIKVKAQNRFGENIKIIGLKALNQEVFAIKYIQLMGYFLNLRQYQKYKFIILM